ncbi:glycosyltransferase [Modestobacter sp. VKM Ac-2985]|uniref:glycosyltransferase n=1 Tax=Modestobacter sp. VKM Ac-2985 TaxID=3004139 RepID=UPI0022AB63C8|nr:hypothetical protein [Modestobacter sp. VKM Ac-2985]MCZ2836030.1 hypothetical protein [Modestobacter sp. VKM Ac-2985]
MALLDRSRVAVLPFRDEAMPMLGLEVMTRGDCGVATDVGGIAAELNPGRLLSPRGDGPAAPA